MPRRLLRQLGRTLVRSVFERGSKAVSRTSTVGREMPSAASGRAEAATRDLVPNEVARLSISYAPDPDGDPDPGEIIWTWVPYAENDGRGKDRPVLIIGRLGPDAVAGCYLSTRQHRGFVSVGSGGWDAGGRESFLAPERLLRVTTAGMRREGHVLARDRFDRAVAVVARANGLTGDLGSHSAA